MIKSRSQHHTNSNHPPHSKAVQTEVVRGQQQQANTQNKLTDNVLVLCGQKMYSRVPLGDCSSQHLNLRIGDMENDSVNGVTAQFQSIDQVQSMIRHLQQLEENMIKNNAQTNGTKGFSASFEDLSLLDANDYEIDENETEWLTKVPGAKKMSAKDLESDESFIDSGLLNFRFALINLVKSAITEEKSAAIISNSPRSSAKTNYEKRTPPQLTTVPAAPLYTSPINKPNNFENYPSRAFATMTLTRPTEPRESSPPFVANNSRRSPFEFLSPSYQLPIEKLTRDSNNYFSTPPGKIDSRTYTRPKKARIPLDTYNNDYHHLEVPVSPITHVQNEGFPIESEIEGIMNPNATINMNETFVQQADFEEQPERIQSEQQAPRRVTRNLSYVIRRDSESPNNNSPVNLPQERDNYDTGVELNNTFVRASCEDTYSPSPTGSSNSIHTTSSMEELHHQHLEWRIPKLANMHTTLTFREDSDAKEPPVLKDKKNRQEEELHHLARQQEQSLRMTSNPRMLTRKETHTVVRVPVIDSSVQPIIKGADLQGQQKMRIQSRIPAPGAGSRIRAPLNNGATRRPITSGGIRRNQFNGSLESWRDGGAY